MTDSEKIAYLAEKVMGWEKKEWEVGDPGAYWNWARKDTREFAMGRFWNPLESWDSWRQVEERVMKDERLWCHFVTDLVPACSVDTDYAMLAYAATDLPTRVDCLVQAHRSLHP